MFVSTLACLTLLLYTSSTLWRLFCNYQLAKKTKLPILFNPINPYSAIWIVLRPYVNPVFAYLPYNLSRFTTYNYLGWAWRDKTKLHSIFGPAFIIVTPAENQLIVGDATACEDLLKRWRDYVRNPRFRAPLDIFGPNVGTAEGSAWQRQRKITIAAFSEKNHDLVWSEAVKQTTQMVSRWSNEEEITSTAEDCAIFATHVLTGAGFGKSYDFHTAMMKPTEGHRMSYRDALSTILKNVFVTYAVASSNFLQYILPKQFGLVPEAIKEFRKYMAEMLEHERASNEAGKDTGNANLLANLLRASEEGKKETQDGAVTRGGLADDEIWGNLFTFNVAGQETTAITLTYTIALLACYPEVQEWLKQEIDEVFGPGPIEQSECQQAFPRLKRCLATMVSQRPHELAHPVRCADKCLVRNTSRLRCSQRHPTSYRNGRTAASH